MSGGYIWGLGLCGCVAVQLRFTWQVPSKEKSGFEGPDIRPSRDNELQIYRSFVGCHTVSL